MRTCPRAILLILLVAPSIQLPARAGALPEEKEARRIGTAALPEILSLVDADDPALRLRARRLAQRIALDFYEAEAPAGMRFVPGAIAVGPDGVRCDDGFYLGVHEVTLGEFRAFARRTGMDVDRWGDGDDALPAAGMTLEEARAFALDREARLPTLAELERAAHGGGRLRYPWGERFEPGRVNSREAGRGQAEPVGSRPGGVSVHGISDLLGNVAEWTETPADESGRRFVAAGGSYRGYARAAALATYRLAPTSRLPDVGLRLARSLPPIPARAPAGS